MASSHELLDVSLAQLDSVNDEFIKQAYEKKLAALNQEDKARMALLEKAYADLINHEKRLKYLEKIKATAPLISTNVRNVNQVTSCGKSADVDDILKEYANFVDKQYKDHPNRNTFKGEKFSFSSFDQFQKSDFYKDLSAEDRKQYSKDNFPKQAIVLRFDSWEDALAFTQDMENKNKMAPGTTQRFREQLLDKGWIDEAGKDLPPPVRKMTP